MRRLMLVVGVLGFGLPTDATADAGATAAALANEAAECRYVASLCATAVTARDDVQRQIAAGEAAKTQGDLTAMTVAVGLADDALARLGLARREIEAAARVVAAKHAKPPACLAECSMLDPSGALRRP